MRASLNRNSTTDNVVQNSSLKHALAIQSIKNRSAITVNISGKKAKGIGFRFEVSNQNKSEKSRKGNKTLNETKSDKMKTVENKKFNKANNRCLRSFNRYLTEDDEVKNVNEYTEDIPDKIEYEYKNDLNLDKIHEIIIKKFIYKKETEVPKLRKKLEEERQKLDTPQPMVKRKKIISDIRKLEEMISNIVNDKDFGAYLRKIKPLIEEYNLLGTLTDIVSMALSGKSSKNMESPVSEDDKSKKKRHSIIFDFIEIARKYVNLDIIRDIEKVEKCEVCGELLNPIDEESDDVGLIICDNCGLEKPAVARYRFYRDNTRTNNSGNNYQDRANFEKILIRKQGKQQDKPPACLYEELEEYFQKKRLPKINDEGTNKMKYVSPEELRNMPLTKDGEKRGTSRMLMYKALGETGNSNYYDHIDVILNKMWNWKLEDYSDIHDDIMSDYDNSQQIYVKIKNIKSTMNNQFRLFKILRRRGVKCYPKDFRIPTTHDIRERLENTWDKICNILGWDNI